jgi:peptidoglycan/LPS O-acetylase OafA/YrhL
MNIYTPLGYFFVLASVLLFMKLPVFAATDTKWHASTSRTITIDGLRGYLAVGVFIHAVIYYRYLTEGIWDNPPSSFYTQLGPINVSLFFMITGYLFWGKIISTQGRPGWTKLFIGRAFRIGPVYFLMTGLMLLIIFSKTSFVLQEPLEKVLFEIAPLLLFGIFEPGQVINGFSGPRGITAAVTWTLRYEWVFYLIILPISAIFARNRKHHLVYAVTVLLVCLASSLLKNGSSNSLLLAAFFIGMVYASLQAHECRIAASDRTMSIVASIALWLVFFEPIPTYKTVHTILTGVVFYGVVNGCSLFGLLTNKRAQRLGEISYGIYLLQGIVLFAFAQAPEIRTLATVSIIHYWFFLLIEAFTLIILAFIAYCFLEKPCITTGKKIVLQNFTSKTTDLVNDQKTITKESTPMPPTRKSADW